MHRFLGHRFQTFQKVSEAVLMFGNPMAAAQANTPEKRKMKDMANRVIQGTAYLICQGNHVHVVAPESGPVATFAIVGDTGGPDHQRRLEPQGRHSHRGDQVQAAEDHPPLS